MQTGGFQNQVLMRMTILFTLLFLTGFWVSNFAMFFAKMGLTPDSVQAYYLGSEQNFTLARPYQSMLEVSHAHLPMMAMVVLLLTHLLIFAPYTFRTKVTFISSSFLLAFANEAAGWLVRFVHPGFAWLKIGAFVGFQATLAFLLIGLSVFLLKSQPRNGARRPQPNSDHDRAHTPDVIRTPV